MKAIRDKVCHVTSQALQYYFHAWKKRQESSFEMSCSGIDSAARVVSQMEIFKGDFFEGFLSDREEGIKRCLL